MFLIADMIKKICVYCGSSSGNDPRFVDIARQMGIQMAKNGLTLVYGGAKVGLMGALADGCLDSGGTVIGVIPDFLNHKEVAHDGLTELIITQSMHQRKTIMAEKSDAFVALPGGMGTLEEVAEILTWKQLGLVSGPVGILNLDGYYDDLLSMFHVMNKAGLLKDEHLSMVIESDQPESLISSILGHNHEDQTPKKLDLT